MIHHLARGELAANLWAPSNVAPMQSRIRTVRDLLGEWGLALVPFTVEKVYALGASLRWYGYSSAKQYLSTAAAQAERECPHIGPEPGVARALKDVKRACERGLGKSQGLAEALPFESLGDHPEEGTPWLRGSPLAARAAVILGSWWGTRELELACARA